jgi:hypothetical protein
MGSGPTMIQGVPETIPGVRTMIAEGADDDSGRADVGGGAGSFVHGEEIEVGIGADGASSSQEIGT